jgi:TRAP-type C4-dicarboxylate transport system substrate-binding protein
MGRLSDDEKKALSEILAEAADKCTDDIAKMEKELAGWFKEQGKNVVAVDRKPFREAVVKMHLGSDATWDKAVYDRLQSIQSATN